MKKIITILCCLVMCCCTYAQPFKAFSVTVQGKGQPIILIPGFSCSGEVWDATVARLSRQYECHVLTLAGYAGVPAVDSPSLQIVRDEIIRYTKEKQLQQPILIGHSLGAFMSLWVSSTAPGLFGKVICVDGVPFITAMADSTLTEEKIKADPGYNPAAVAANFESIPNEDYIDYMAKSMLYQVNETVHARQIAIWSYRSNRKTLGYTYAEMAATDLRMLIAQIKQPVLVLGSIYNGSASNSYRILQEQYRHLNNKTIHVANSKHFIMYDQPQWWYNELDTFLQ